MSSAVSQMPGVQGFDLDGLDLSSSLTESLNDLVDLPVNHASTRSRVRTSEPIVLHGVHSLRDLGGYSFTRADGTPAVTRSGVFLRGGSLSFLTGGDVRTLKRYGLTRIIDLRSPFELKLLPDRFCRGKHPEIGYVSVPMLDGINSHRIHDQVPDRMSDVYCGFLDNDAESIRQVFLALDGEGCVLFHCRAGKDRTGVIAMLLLKLVGVDDATVVADYAVSDRYAGRTWNLQRIGLRIIARRPVGALFKSAPEEMERTLSHLDREYGSARAYLEGAAEVPSAVLDRIVERFTGRSATV